MPVTKTAKRALRSSKKKREVNKKIISNLEIAIRNAKKGRKEKDILAAISQADRAAKKRVIHKNKASRIKSTLSKLLLVAKPQKKSRASKVKSSKKQLSL